MHAAGEAELARISVPETVAKIRAKQAAKPKHSPLPASPASLAVAGLTDEQRATIQTAADTAHRVLCAGGDYGDELSDAGLRRELKAARDALHDILAATHGGLQS